MVLSGGRISTLLCLLAVARSSAQEHGMLRADDRGAVRRADSCACVFEPCFSTPCCNGLVCSGSGAYKQCEDSAPNSGYIYDGNTCAPIFSYAGSGNQFQPYTTCCNSFAYINIENTCSLSCQGIASVGSSNSPSATSAPSLAPSPAVTKSPVGVSTTNPTPSSSATPVTTSAPTSAATCSCIFQSCSTQSCCSGLVCSGTGAFKQCEDSKPNSTYVYNGHSCAPIFSFAGSGSQYQPYTTCCNPSAYINTANTCSLPCQGKARASTPSSSPTSTPTTSPTFSPTAAATGFLGHKDSVQPIPTIKCPGPSCCYLNSSLCRLDSLPIDETRLVVPGGATKCLLENSGPYAFQVIRGDPKRVLLFFQGGGICWDQTSFSYGLCLLPIYPSNNTGVFNRTNPRNPYQNYTVVQVLYCSGDLHFGNVARNWTSSYGHGVGQYGYVNTLSVLSWIQAQQTNGALAKQLKDYVVMGCSAGALAVQLWGATAISSLSWKNAAVIADSFAGVFPAGIEGFLFKISNSCNKLPKSIQASCLKGTLTLQNVTSLTISSLGSLNPPVPFGFIQSKADGEQKYFYEALNVEFYGAAPTLTSDHFYQLTNTVFERYNTQKNLVLYYVDGSQHCFTDGYRLYNTDLSGIKGTPILRPTLISWLTTFKPSSSSVQSRCDGQRAGGIINTTMCDSMLFNKTFVK